MINLQKSPEHLRNGFKDPKRLSAIHEIPCALAFYLGQTQTSRTTAHHKIGMGIGKKASDLLTMSLSEEFHQTGPHAIHHIGVPAFEKKFNVTQNELIEITDKLLEKLN